MGKIKEVLDELETQLEDNSDVTMISSGNILHVHIDRFGEFDLVINPESVMIYTPLANRDAEDFIKEYS